MTVLTSTVSRDLDADVTFVDLNGRLAVGTTATIRSELLKCIAECPVAVIVDMSGCVAETLTALTVFRTVARHHAQQPSVAVLLCGTDDSFQQASVRAALGPVPTFASRSDARLAVAAVRARQRRLTLRYGPTLDAPSEARLAVADACDRWGLSARAAVAMLVTSELVTNAVRHAGTAISVDASVRGPYLHLRVRDGSDLAPVLSVEPWDPTRDHGRGLPIVASHCTAWGYVANPTGHGKLVWATLRVD
jgi:hypothetical protein